MKSSESNDVKGVIGHALAEMESGVRMRLDCRSGRSEDNCTIRKRDGEVSVKFTDPGRCTVVAWALSPNPIYVASLVE